MDIFLEDLMDSSSVFISHRDFISNEASVLINSMFIIVSVLGQNFLDRICRVESIRGLTDAFYKKDKNVKCCFASEEH